MRPAAGEASREKGEAETIRGLGGGQRATRTLAACRQLARSYHHPETGTCLF